MTIHRYELDDSLEEPISETICGSETPEIYRSDRKASIIFRTDVDFPTSGFQLKYYLSGIQLEFHITKIVLFYHFLYFFKILNNLYNVNLDCGGFITEPAVLEPLKRNDVYHERMNCTWVIEAPQSKKIVLRFNKLILEYNQWWRTF